MQQLNSRTAETPEIRRGFITVYPHKTIPENPLWIKIPRKIWCETVGIQGREEGEETFRSRRKGCSEWRQQSSDFPSRLGTLGCSRWPKWAAEVIELKMWKMRCFFDLPYLKLYNNCLDLKKMDGWNTILSFWDGFFRCYVSISECTYLYSFFTHVLRFSQTRSWYFPGT